MNRILIIVVLMAVSLVACKNGKKSKAAQAETTAQSTPASKTEANTTEVKEDNAQQEEVVSNEALEANAQSNEEQHKPAMAEDAFFIMQRTPCFGQCPVYSLEIKQNGAAYLDGIRNYDFEGMHVAKLTEYQVEQIRALADKFGYYDFNHVYDAPVTDLPSVTTAIQNRDGMHWVYNRMEAPDALNQFQIEVETLIKDLQWSPQE